MNWDMSDETNPVEDLERVENALRHELHGAFVPFDGSRAEEMIEAATRAQVSRLPRMAAPLGTAAAVLALGAGVAVFAANGTGNNPAPAGGPSSQPTPTGHVSCEGFPRPVPMRTMPPQATDMPRVPAMGPTGKRPRKIYHLPPRLLPGHHLTCSTGGAGIRTLPCRVPPPRPPKGHLLPDKVICAFPSRSASVGVPRVTRWPAPPPVATRSGGQLRFPPAGPPAASPMISSPAPTAIRSGGRLLVPPRGR